MWYSRACFGSLLFWIYLCLGPTNVLADTKQTSPAQTKTAIEESKGNEDISLSAFQSKDDLRAAAEKIRKELQFSRLRKMRRDVLEKIPKIKGEIDSLQTKVTGLRTEQIELKKKLASLGSEAGEPPEGWEALLANARLEFKELSDRGRTDNQTEKEYEEQIKSTRSKIDFLSFRVREARSAKEARSNFEKRQSEIEAELPTLVRVLEEKTILHDELLEQQFLVEDAINVMLIPETAQNKFKLYITGAFSALVGLVILGFFLVSWRDELVRRAIFSGQSGIQFLTLFSLVIAIILFGITNILEGKELAALLGGLSGYILGRVTDRSA